MLTSPTVMRHRQHLVLLLIAILGAMVDCNTPVRCQRRGGMFYASIRGGGNCVFPTRDGGKPCRSKKECEYECWADEGIKTSPPQGRCAIWPIPDGCHNRIEDGKAQGFICTMQ